MPKATKPFEETLFDALVDDASGAGGLIEAQAKHDPQIFRAMRPHCR